MAEEIVQVGSARFSSLPPSLDPSNEIGEQLHSESVLCPSGRTIGGNQSERLLSNVKRIDQIDVRLLKIDFH